LSSPEQPVHRELQDLGTKSSQIAVAEEDLAWLFNVAMGTGMGKQANLLTPLESEPETTKPAIRLCFRFARCNILAGNANGEN